MTGQTFTVYGVAASIDELGRIDKELAKAARARIKDAAGPLVQNARRFVPTGSPLSHWKAGRGDGWSATARSRITAKVATKAGRRSEIPLLRIVQNDKEGSIFDMAGRKSSGNTPQGRAFITSLNRRYGSASRSMWRGVPTIISTVETNLQLAVKDLEEQLDRRLGRH